MHSTNETEFSLSSLFCGVYIQVHKNLSQAGREYVYTNLEFNIA